MSAALVLLFLGSAEARAEASVHLQSWAQARWVRLDEPAASTGPEADLGEDTALQIETHLENARLALGGLDLERAGKELDAAEAVLRRSASLPQAAWLMAERWVLGAELLTRSDAPRDQVEALLVRAALLEGTRAPSYGDPIGPWEFTSPPSIRLRLDSSQGDEVYWNGRKVSLPLSAPVGEHHLRITRRGRTLLSRWVQVSPKAARLPTPAQTPCSSDDLAGTRRQGDRVIPPPHVACPRWAVAHATAQGVRVATCEANRCGPLLPWRQGDGVTYADPPQPRAVAPFPTWIAIGTGVGAAVLTSIVLIHSGAFRDAEPGRRRFVYTGPNGN